MSATHYVAYVESPAAFSGVPLPFGKSVPFNWPAFALRRGTDLALKWRFTPPRPSHFRLTFALAERERKVIEVSSAANGEVLGCFDVFAPSLLQTAEIEINSPRADLSEGVILRILQGSDPAWFFGVEQGHRAPSPLAPALLPHALELDDFAPGDALAEFYPRMQSMASLQPFDWRAGAVFEGLWSLSRLPGGGKARTALNSQLALYVTPGGRLSYEHPATSRVVEDRPHSMEALYPLGVLAQLDPFHPAVSAALEWALEHKAEDGTILQGDLLLKDALCLAPFLASLAERRQNDQLAQLAFTQLETRRTYLVLPDAIWSRLQTDGRQHGQNRARSLAFYALAVARVLEFLPRHPEAEKWREEARRLGSLIFRAQRGDNLWGPYFHPQGDVDNEGEPDLGTSAALALVLASGARDNWLPGEARQAAGRAASALRSRLTPDGYLCAAASEEGRPAGSPFPVGGFTADAFEVDDFQLPEPPPVYPTRELAPWAMGWMASTLAELS